MPKRPDKNRDSAWDQLAKTNRHWRAGKRLLADERARVERLATRGDDPSRSREALQILEEAVMALEDSPRKLMLEVEVGTASVPIKLGRQRRPSAGGS